MMALEKETAGDYNGAVELYNKAAEIIPDSFHEYYNRGKLKRKLAYYNGAIADYNQALKLNPRYAEILISRGIVKTLLKNCKNS